MIPAPRELPSFDVTVFAERSSRYALVIPVINEGSRIRAQLTAMHETGHARGVDVIIADGGSTDGSLPEDALRKNGVRALLVKTGPGRLSAQLRMAYAWCLDEGYEGIVTIDGNGKDSIESIPSFAAALDRGIDYAQASRFVRGGRGVRTPWVRWIAIRMVHAPVLSIAARHWLTDTTQGFRAYSRRYLLHPDVQPFRAIFADYELLPYLSVRASQLSLNVEELPTTRTYPEGGKIPTKISGLSSYVRLLRTLWWTLTGRYHPRR